MILWPLLISLPLLGIAQDQSIEEYCFSSSGKMQAVHTRLKFILVPIDKVQENQNCFTVNTPSHRRELIQNYVRRLEPSVQIAFSSAEVKRDPCHIKVEKVRVTQQDTLTGGVNVSGDPQITNANVDVTASQLNKSGKDVTTIQTLKEFELRVNQDSISGECRFITPTRYEITLHVKKEAIPLTPPVPPGTIVVVQDAQLPKQIQETASLQTTLQLNRGEKMEIGSIVKNLRDNAAKADINSGIGANKTDGVQNEKVYLSID